jgi:hypothetical protein
VGEGLSGPWARVMGYFMHICNWKEALAAVEILQRVSERERVCGEQITRGL